MAIKRQMIAGILLTLAVALVAKFVSPWLPTLGAEALAMVLGIILGNTVFAQQRWGAGVKSLVSDCHHRSSTRWELLIK